MCFVCLLGSITAASGRFRSGCRTVVKIVPSGVFGVCLPSFCLSPPIPLAFFRSGDPTVTISYLLGSFSVYPPFCHRQFRLRPFVQAVESWLYCYSSCVCALFDTHQGIGDMVILRFRVSYCGVLGSILSCIFGFYSDPPTPVPLVPVFTGPPNYGNPGFSVAQIAFSSTTTVGFQLPSPLCKDTEPLHYRPHE